MINEVNSRTAEEELQQGDVLELATGEGTPWNRHLLVVTADCDLAYNKHSGRITCIPLLSPNEYLLEIYFPEQHGILQKAHVEAFKAALSEAGLRPPSNERLVAWCNEVDDPTEVSLAYEVPPPTTELLQDACEGIRIAARRWTTVQNATTDLVRSQNLIQTGRKPDSLLKEAKKAIKQRFTQPRGDSLFLNAIAPGYEEGYFAYLRHIEQVWEQSITLGPSRAASGYRRIGALSERFSHAVVQRFALVFMPIGLPDEYEETRNAYAERLEEQLH
ncbi:hypothetical protein ACFWHT_02205 [Microbacterium sp. NPDC058342]|uniref:hypothetical protein n=1 Tax=Microbacterium sp. NPDC058342 TaxID=3346454 RepID=UPI00365AB244